MFSLRLFGLGLALILSLLVASPAVAQGGSVINHIRIEGNQRIEEGTVRSYLLVQEGDVYDPRRVDRSVKSLFATGLFADVTIRHEGDTLIVNVVENPVINRIAFEGNLRIKDEVLQSEVSLRPRVVFTRTKVQQDVQRILEIYRASGRFAATVDPKVIQLGQNRVDLVYEINEGPLTQVESIRFIGNHAMSDSELRSVIRTKESAWYRFFSNDDTYDPDRLTLDRELLRRFYLGEGYADIKVNSAVAELTPDRRAFFITFSLEEGERYKFGKVDVKSSLKGLDPKQVADEVEPEEGDWYNNRIVDDTVENLSEAVSNKGFAFVEVRPRVNRNRETKQIDVTFDIREGPRIFVERIDITGNVRTVDKVIRREMRLVEGDAFNAAKMRRSRTRIKDLDFFENVDVEQVPGSAPDKAVVTVNVQEKSTGALSFGVGYSTSEGPLLDVGVRERNLLGRAYDLNLNGTLAGARSQINLSFTNPYFLDREIAAGFDVFHIRRNLTSSSGFDTKTTGAGVRAGYPITEYLRQSWGYTFKTIEITNVEPTASTLVRQQEGTNYISEINHSLFYDRRNSKIDPTEGYYLGMTNEVAGLGGTSHFMKNIFRAGQFFPITKDVVFTVSGQAGHIFGFGEDVKIQDRFFVGGDLIRGFSNAGVGPRDITSHDALGGEWMYAGTAELRFPLGLPDEFGIRGRVFADAGSAGTVTPADMNTFDSKSLRASVGFGVSYRSPFGPLGLDVGFPILKDDLDEEELFRINIGTRF